MEITYFCSQIVQLESERTFPGHKRYISIILHLSTNFTDNPRI